MSTDSEMAKIWYLFKGTFRLRGSQKQLCRFLILRLITMSPAYFHLRSISKMVPQGQL